MENRSEAIPVFKGEHIHDEDQPHFDGLFIVLIHLIVVVYQLANLLYIEVPCPRICQKSSSKSALDVIDV